MFGKRVFLVSLVALMTIFVVVACSETEIATQEPVEFNPTAADAVEAPDTPAEDKPVANEPLATGGDAGAGESLFNQSGCTGCHSTGDGKVVGPGLGGIYARAGSRTSLDADAYIAQSVREPGAFLVDGFPAVMPTFAQFSDDDVENLIAYLKTLN